MKIIAYFLPQFHPIPENDKWWGTGFTEWTNTKKAKPLFTGHYQPREPMDNFYYNLTDPKVRKWQSNLTKKYGIYGFCYYHYWFSGKKLLEKPLEDLLKLKDITTPFCISWANHTWNRSWTHEEKEVLQLQTYGDETEWMEHFNYLLNFFKDDRYIKIDNKPLMVIYRPLDMPNCKERLAFYNKMAKLNGFSGMYFVETLHMGDSASGCGIEGFDAMVEFEPLYSINPSYAQIQFYDEIWRNILERKRETDKEVFLGAFPGWDNTARKKEKGLYIVGSTPEKFGYYLQRQIEIAKKIGSNFIFINAWNEWAESAYLEPDKKYGYKYLENVKLALNGDVKQKHKSNYNKNILSLIPDDVKVVLHINCREAYIAKYLKEKYKATVIGTEKNEKYHNIASNNLDFLLPIDIEKDEENVLAPEFFDCILIENAIEKSNNPLELLNKLKVLVKDDGCIIISVKNIGHISNINNLINHGTWTYSKDGQLKEDIRFFTKTDFIKNIENANYEIVSINEEKKMLSKEEKKLLLFLKQNIKDLKIQDEKSLEEAQVYKYIFKIRKRFKNNKSDLELISMK